jgi:RimJ/RimL family protein N-acetyltransferase
LPASVVPIGLGTAESCGADPASGASKPEWANNELRTARLSLRHPVASDLEAVLRIHQVPEAVAHDPSDAIEDQAGAGRLPQRWIDHWRRHAVGYWAVSWGGDPSVFGFCGIKVMSLLNRPSPTCSTALTLACGVATS